MFPKSLKSVSGFILSVSLLSLSTFYSSNSYAISCVDVDECPHQVKKIKQFARYGSPTAQLMLAMLFKEGTLVEKNPKKMFHWLRKAYKTTPKNAPINQAQHLLALSYLSGDGTSKDIKAGLRHLTKSATKGYVKSQLVLGLIYFEGISVENDYLKATHWLQLAAKQKSASAEYFLGQINENGLGINKNMKQAMKWYRLGAKHHNHLAKLRLEDMEKNLSPTSNKAIVNIKQVYPEGIYASAENTIVIHPNLSKLNLMDAQIKYLSSTGLYSRQSRTGSRIPGKICSQGAQYCASITNGDAITEFLFIVQNANQGEASGN